MKQYDLYDGTPPHVPHCDTSIAAAVRALPRVETLRMKALGIIHNRHDAGATCDEVEAITGERHQTISARIRELVLLGKIRDSGARRNTRSGRAARIYVVCPPRSIHHE